MEHPKRVAVIGAGLAGLTAARSLAQSFDVTVFEKSRGVGGRMSTRRADPFQFDHGAQYFTARSDEFRHFLEPALSDGTVKEWQGRFVELTSTDAGVDVQDTARKEPVYVAVPGMNALAKSIARDLDLRLATRVSAVSRSGSGMWRLTSEDWLSLGEFDRLVIAVPARQAFELLNGTAAQALADEVGAAGMHACFAVMCGFSSPLDLDWAGARVRNSPVGWMALNSSKPGRGGGCSFLIQSSNLWADRNVDMDREGAGLLLLEAASGLIGHDLSLADHQVVHFWRYANAPVRKGGPCFSDPDHGLIVCGDWCIEGRVENAFISGRAAATALLDAARL